METRQLGQDGPHVSALGLGTWPLGGGMGQVDEQTAIDTVRAAIDQGMTLIDTAQMYRSSEARIGKALQGGYRERCFVATKVSRDYTPQGIEEAMQNSLSSLATDYVDLYQIHSWNPRYPIAESMAAMAELQAAGKTRYLGVSNFSAAQMAEALQTAPFHSSQPRYNLFDRGIENEDIPFCQQRGIGILAHSPLAKGLLSGKYHPEHTFPDDDERSSMPRFQGERFKQYLQAADKLAVLAADKGISLVQLSVAWLLAQPGVTCVLVGAKNPHQVDEQIGAAEVSFADDELRWIDTTVAGLIS